MIHPVILCGGSGTRLWPVSRKSFPKQFSNIFGDISLFQSAATRLMGDNYAMPTIATGDSFRFIVKEQLENIGILSGNIIIEPSGKNTAPAILAAALEIKNQDKDAIMVVMPSDHIIQNKDDFKQAIEGSIQAVNDGKIVTFGIMPTHPETGYGYLELNKGVNLSGKSIEPLISFVEKPNKDKAIKMLADGNYLWNAGIFMFKVDVIIDAYKKYSPNLFETISESVATKSSDIGFTRLGVTAWENAENISIDYAIMEKTDNIVAMPYCSGWSDLGGWDAVWKECGPDENENVKSDNSTLIDCKNTLLRSDSPNLEVVGIGLENIIAIAMSDAVLIANKSEAQRVKEAVDALNAKSSKQATQFPYENRPWGNFESLAMGSRFQVKRIIVKPGQSLSLQSHLHRAEHWIVVEGTANVTLDEKTVLISENQSIYIPIGCKHRLENPGKFPLILIEVQTGSYLGEDDIIRYEDIYNR